MASSRPAAPSRADRCRPLVSMRRLGRAALTGLLALSRETRGVMMVEAVVAVSVFALVGTAVLAGIGTAQLSGSRVETDSVAENIARNQMEDAFTQIYREPGWQPYNTLAAPAGYSVTATSDFAQRDCDYDIEKVRVTVTRDGGEVLSVETLRARSDGFGLRVSNSSNRSNSESLTCGTISGTAYVFLDDPEVLLDDPQSPEDQVTWLLDGQPFGDIEYYYPWDLKGGDEPTANPWDTTALVNGEHTITARVQMDGSEVYVSAGFTIAN